MAPEDVVPRLDWGLDLSNPDVTTQAEIDEFRSFALKEHGTQQQGLDFWLDEDPSVLKRYRWWAETLRKPNARPSPANGPAMVIAYAQAGYVDGLKYTLTLRNRLLNKAEMLEVFNLAFRYVGPAGMACIAEAAREHVWQEPTRLDHWPQGWGPDPDVFRSGVDFSIPTLSDDEYQMIEQWYLRYLGEVPGHVSFLGRHRPEVLKAYRSRFENTLRLLPKQVEPYVLIQVSVERAFPQGVREGVLMARGFGLAKADVLEAMTWGSFRGTTPALDIVHECVADILDAWQDPT